jgi:hypothetical protein
LLHVYLPHNNTQKHKAMNTLNSLEEILNSKEFNELFDWEAEKKEIESAGWNYKQTLNFGKQLGKKIK